MLIVTRELRVDWSRIIDNLTGPCRMTQQQIADEIGVIPANPAGMRPAHRDRTGAVQGASKLDANSDPWAVGQEAGW